MTTFNGGLRSSASIEWYTPRYLFEQIQNHFGVKFELDVCATERSAKCDRYFTPEVDGLAHRWSGECWMNPPYGKEIGVWMRRAVQEARSNICAVTCLVPARTDTEWWHDTVPHASEVVFIKKRVKFETAYGVGQSAPFPSAVVRFDGRGDPQTVRWGCLSQRASAPVIEPSDDTGKCRGIHHADCSEPTRCHSRDKAECEWCQTPLAEHDAPDLRTLLDEGYAVSGAATREHWWAEGPGVEVSDMFGEDICVLGGRWRVEAEEANDTDAAFLGDARHIAYHDPIVTDAMRDVIVAAIALGDAADDALTYGKTIALEDGLARFRATLPSLATVLRRKHDE